MKIRLLFPFLIALIFGAQWAQAGTTYTWNGGASGNWTTASNWSPSTGYPGSSGTTDIARINTSNAVITLSASLTIASLQSTNYGVSGVKVQFSGSAVLTVNSGLTTAQPSSASNGIIFSGTGTANIGGSSQLGYQSSMSILSGATVNFIASSTFSFPNNHSGITNAGALNFLTGSSLTLQDQSQLTNTGTLTTTKATITLSGSGSPANMIDNQGTYMDHGSTINITGQNAAFKNSTSSAVCRMRGTTLSFSSGNNGMSLTNVGTFIADSAATLNIGTQSCPITNSGGFYAGTSNSSCIINLTGQSSTINNTGTFYVGSTSGITISGYQAGITAGSAGFFIFQSDAYGSAYLGAVPTNSIGRITGTYYVQRYITGGSSAYRSYRLFSSPVYASTISGNNVYSLNYVNSGSLTTGSGGTSGGFDKSGNPSIYLYRENMSPSNTTYISGNFRGVATINNAPTYTLDGDAGNFNIPVGNGFLFFFRGDRVSNLANKYTPGTSAESSIETATGTMNQGQVTVKDWFTPASSNLSYTAGSPASVRGFNLVGNPYPSSIDWENFQTSSTTTGIYGTNVGNTIYELNPLNANFGAYIKGGGGIGTNNATNIIASGQGFLVVASSASAKLIFNESAKTSTQVTGSNLLMSTAPIATDPIQYLKLQLSQDSINTDDMIIRFKSDATTKFDPDLDAIYKPGNGKVSISSISSDNENLAINSIPLASGTNTRLSVNTTADGIYSLSMKNLQGVPQLYDIWLMDTYKKDSCDMRHNPVYRFNVFKNDTSSFGSNRFALVVRQNQGYAYRLLGFAATKMQTLAGTANQVQLTWRCENEQNYTRFAVQRSVDSGKTYEIIGIVKAAGLGTYSIIDSSPAKNNLYRLMSTDVTNTISYSNIVPVDYADAAIKSVISVYPNPASSNISLTIANPKGTINSYTIMITNSSGLVISQSTTNSATWQGSVAGLHPGTYIIKAFDSKTKEEVGNAKFVKM